MKELYKLVKINEDSKREVAHNLIKKEADKICTILNKELKNPQYFVLKMDQT